jgi:hypothetical protein
MTTTIGRYVLAASVICCLGLVTTGMPIAAAQAPAAANPADQILGDWKPADMDVVVRIFVLKGKYVGGVVKAANPQLVNTELLREIAFDAATGTWRGEIFAVKRGSFVPMTIRKTRDGFEMVAGSGIMSKTIEWVPAPAQPQSAQVPGGTQR